MFLLQRKVSFLSLQKMFGKKMSEDEEEFESVEPPTTLDGGPVDLEEVSKVHTGLVTGDMKIELAPGVADQLEELGLTVDQIKDGLIKSTKKALS